jgi:hypothetical protein
VLRITFPALAAALITFPAFAQPRAAVRQACEADYHRLCATVLPGGGRILKCLTDHDNDLTPDCRSALRSRSK